MGTAQRAQDKIWSWLSFGSLGARTSLVTAFAVGKLKPERF